MWNIKGCPRCGGDMFLDWELHVWYESCLQCGYEEVLQGIGEPWEKVKEDKIRQVIEVALVK